MADEEEVAEEQDVVVANFDKIKKKMKIIGFFPMKLKINTISLSGKINTISRTDGGHGTWWNKNNINKK